MLKKTNLFFSNYWWYILNGVHDELVEQKDEQIQQLQNERTNDYFVLRHQLVTLREECNRLRLERNSANQRASSHIK